MTNEPIFFEAASVPRFEGEGTERRVAEETFSQSALWTAVQEILSSSAPRSNCSVNIRFVGELQTRSVRTIVGATGLKEKSSFEMLRRALPPNYAWKELSAAKALPTEAISRPDKPWFVARIERRLSFVDLPWQLPDSAGLSSAKNGQLSDSSRDASAPRKLIMEVASETDLESERYCLPVCGALEFAAPGYKLLFRELRELAPCVVNLSLAAIDRKQLDSHRRIATFWNAYLRHFGDDISAAGFSDLPHLRAQYNRFLLPDRFLSVLALRVAAPTASAARSVAIHAAARIGGLRNFMIREPKLMPLSALEDPWIDVPSSSHWTDDEFRTRLDRLNNEMSRDDIDVDLIEPGFRDFLIQLPHIYSIDEAAQVAALPLSDGEGLPGVDTKLIPPFSDAARTGAFSAEAQAPLNRLRIGLAPTFAGATANNSPTGEWHTISEDDLTKHAFVVGSTGSGKTVTTLFLARELARLGIPFLIIEPVKTEYFDNLRYVDRLGLRRHRLEGTHAGQAADDFLAFDPMRLQEGVSVARHAAYLKSCFEASFPLDPVSAMMLEAGIRNYYTAPLEQYGCGLGLFTRGGRNVHQIVNLCHKEVIASDGKRHVRTEVATQALPDGAGPGRVIRRRSCVHPSLDGFQFYFLDEFLPKALKLNPGERPTDWQTQTPKIFQRRFEALSGGMIGFSAAKADRLFRQDPDAYDTFAELLSGPTVLELDGVPDNEQKSLLMAFIFTFLFERRQADDLAARETDGHNSERDGKASQMKPGTLRHVLILEEAHRILANGGGSGGRGDGVTGLGAQAKSVSMFVEMLAEIRAFGQGMVIVEQIPTKIVPEVVKNTNLKIMLRLTAADDREFLGSAMNFSDEQKRFVTSLRAESGRGVDMVVFEQQLDQPRLLTLPLPKSTEKPIHRALFD